MPKLYEDKPVKIDENLEWFVKAVQCGDDVNIFAVDKYGNVKKRICSIAAKGLYVYSNAEIADYKDPYPVDDQGRIKIINS